MFGKFDFVKIAAAGLALAVAVSLPLHEYEPQAAKGCLLFSQFAEAAALDREGIETDKDAEVVYTFRIAELWEKLFG